MWCMMMTFLCCAVLSQVLEHFPNIAARCAESGIDITCDPIPVVPAQHYMCGGVQTGLTGQTSVAGLFACGEVCAHHAQPSSSLLSLHIISWSSTCTGLADALL